MPDPLISICLPAYKADRFIDETLASIRAQIFADWELIVVEDGSHDGTEEIVRAFAQTVTQSVVFLRHDVNRGLPGTRNTAIAKARGVWIALIDADDLWTPSHLEKLLQSARLTQADLIHSGVAMFDSDTGRELEIRVPSPEAAASFPLSLYLGNYIIQPSSTLIHTAICRKVGGFDPNCRYVEDREFWLRLVRAGAKVCHDPAVTCRYRQHANAMTKNAAAMAEGVANVFERQLDWDAIPRSLRLERTADAWHSAGRIVLRASPALAQTYFGRALRHRTYSPRLLFFWCVATLLGIFKRKSA